MLYNHFTEELLGLQGVKITNVEQEENLIIHLEMERKRHNCICCGTATDTIHDYRLQKIEISNWRLKICQGTKTARRYG